MRANPDELAASSPTVAPVATGAEPPEVKPAPRRERSAARLQGRRLELADPELWDETVSGIEVFEEATAAIRRYVLLQPQHCVVVALWAAVTFLADVVDILPRLLLTSPTRACGKTRLLTVLGALVRRPLPASSITPSAFFRVIQAAGPTLLLDEMDNARLKEDGELRAVLNSGHERSTAFTIRNVGEHHVPRRFSTWAPVALAAIGRLPDTVASRCITIPMIRRAPSEHIERLKSAKLMAEFERIRRRLARWCVDNADIIAHSEPVVPTSLDDREADNWTPLLAIADAVGGSWPARARAAAACSVGVRDEQAPAIVLLADLRELFNAQAADRLSTDSILVALSKLDGRPWPEWHDAKPISARGLAKLLKPFGIEPRTVKWPGGRTAKGYMLEWFEDAFARYLPPQPSPPSPPAPTAAEASLSKAAPNSEVSEGRVSPHPHQLPLVTEVTDGRPPIRTSGDSGTPVECAPCAKCGERVIDWGGLRICTNCRRRPDRAAGLGADGQTLECPLPVVGREPRDG
jgi:putative DNA primase/helicase